MTAPALIGARGEPLISTARFPLVNVTMPAGAMSDDGLRSLLARIDQLVAERKRIALVVDYRPLNEVPNPTQRAELARWMRETARGNQDVIIATAHVVASTLLRGAITAVNWIQRPVTPQYVAADLAEAERWCRTRLTTLD
jgi:hypothetical protein